jgi:hypothetical protein
MKIECLEATSANRPNPARSQTLHSSAIPCTSDCTDRDWLLKRLHKLSFLCFHSSTSSKRLQTTASSLAYTFPQCPGAKPTHQHQVSQTHRRSAPHQQVPGRFCYARHRPILRPEASERSTTCSLPQLSRLQQSGTRFLGSWCALRQKLLPWTCCQAPNTPK